MEVHAHTHPAPAGHRRKWTHYLWEFLMLFLAVFCGFLAENQREHLIEDKRAKKYIQSLTEDLKNDRREFSIDSITWNRKIYLFDSLREELALPALPADLNEIYKQAKRVYGITTFRYNDRTIEQLRHSGEFRLLKKEVVAKLIDYDSKLRTSVRDREAILIRTYGELLDIQNALFDSRVFDQLRRLENTNTDTAALAKQIVYTPLANNPEKQFLYRNKLYQLQYDVTSVLHQETQAKVKLALLLDEIKKQYPHNQ